VLSSLLLLVLVVLVVMVVAVVALTDDGLNEQLNAIEIYL
jgi:hypothetical protein